MSARTDGHVMMVNDDEKRIALSAMADLVTPMAIRVAATLRVADHIARGIRVAPELAREVGANADVLDRILHHLAAVGVLSRDASGQYELTLLGEGLREDHPSGLRMMLDLEGAVGRADLSFVQLLHSVRTGEPAFPAHFGRTFWDDLAIDPARTASYAAQMGADVSAWARTILPVFDWGSLGQLIDLGGGDGTLLAALLSAHPGLRGAVLDLPQTAGAAQRTLNAARLGDRARFLAGSFFDPLPKGAGRYLLSAILHDWDDDSARAILRRCAEAAGEDGKVLVVERTGEGGESPHTGMNLRMFVYFSGRERGVTELGRLAADAGLKVSAVHAAGVLSVLELTAAETRDAGTRR